MNEMNHLEKQLESLIPRRPSARLKHRLFPESASANAIHTASGPAKVPLMMWLTPCACMFMLLLSLRALRPDFNGRFPVTDGSNLLAGLSSNLVSITADGAGSERENIWSALTFEWTSANTSVSTMGSFPQWKTNIQKL